MEYCYDAGKPAQASLVLVCSRSFHARRRYCSGRFEHILRSVDEEPMGQPNFE